MRAFDLEFKNVWQTISISGVKFKMASTSGDYAVNVSQVELLSAS